MNAARALKTLIRACVDDARTLRHERTLVDAGRAEVLRRLAREREHFVEELEHLGARGQSRPSSSLTELLREVGRSAAVLAAGCANNGDAIASCRHSRARTEARYEAALQRTWPDEIRHVLVEQRRCLHDEASTLDEIQF